MEPVFASDELFAASVEISAEYRKALDSPFCGLNSPDVISLESPLQAFDAPLPVQILSHGRDFNLPVLGVELFRPVFSCDCGQTFLKKRYLKDHQRVHSDERPYQCPQCMAAFKFKSHLNDHLRSHRDERRFHCNTGDKACGRSSTLKRHERSHTQVKPYVCQGCLKSFSQSGNLKVHMKSHCKGVPAPLNL